MGSEHKTSYEQNQARMWKYHKKYPLLYHSYCQCYLANSLDVPPVSEKSESYEQLLRCYLYMPCNQQSTNYLPPFHIPLKTNQSTEWCCLHKPNTTSIWPPSILQPATLPDKWSAVLAGLFFPSIIGLRRTGLWRCHFQQICLDTS